MTSDQVLNVFSQALLVATKLAMPMLIISMVVGLVVAVFQAATQIHEQTLTFVPKLLVIALLLLLTGSWMISVMNDFIHWLFSIILLI